MLLPGDGKKSKDWKQNNMELRKNLGKEKTKGGFWKYFAIFFCSYCLQEVIRERSNGLMQKSCGCVFNQLVSEGKKGSKNPAYSHGGKGTRLYKIWDGMKQRILNPNSNSYSNYGGREISICPEWAESYIVFRDWALNNGYQENLTIDRKNPDGNYEPINCRWITREENSRYKRTTILTDKNIIEIRKKYIPYKYTAKMLSKEYGVGVGQIFRIVCFKCWKQVKEVEKGK